MAIFSIFKNVKEEVSLLVDIGNGSITTSLVLFKEKELPEFLFVESSNFLVGSSPDARKLIGDMEKTLDSLLHSLIKNGFSHKYWQNKRKNIDSALIVFSSPWFTSKTNHIHLSQEKDFVITNKFLNDVLTAEEDRFIKELTKNLPNTDSGLFNIIEKSIVHTKINGYILDSVIGKKTKQFDTFIHMAIVGRNITQKIEELISRYAHIDEDRIVFHTFPLVSFSVIRDIFHTTSDFVIMDVTSDVTDITLVQNDIIIKSVSMPCGRNLILRQVSKALDSSIEIAESMIKLYIDNKLEKENLEKIERVLVDLEKEWAIYLENALQELCVDMHLPKKVYLTSETDSAFFFEKFLMLSKTDTTSDFRKNIDITKIERETLSAFYKTDFKSKTNQFIGMVALFYNKFFQTR